MRFFNLVAILALVGVSADVSDVEADVSDVEVTRNLRGSEEDRDLIEEDRDLVFSYTTGAASSYSKSAAFSFEKCWKSDECGDVYAHCFALAYSDAMAGAYGNSHAAAEFFAAAFCGALAEAHGRSCACVHAKGNIDLDAKTVMSGYTSGMEYNLTIALKSASMTWAKASTAAAAAAYATGGGYVYAGTDEEYCASEDGKHSYYCDKSGAKAYAEVSATAFGGAGALSSAAAASGASSGIKGYLSASGQKVSKVSAQFTAVAQSWAFSEAASAALAVAYTEVCADAAAIALQCDAAYDKHCSSGCGDKKQACDLAIAYASGSGVSVAGAVAASVAKAFAAAKIAVTYGGTLENVENNGKPLYLALPGSKTYCKAYGAAFCPHYY